MATSEETLINFATAVAHDIKALSESIGVAASFEVTNPINSDLLQYADGKWKNIRKETISDGGNF